MFNPNGAANDGTKQPSAHTRIYSSPFFLFFSKSSQLGLNLRYAAPDRIRGGVGHWPKVFSSDYDKVSSVKGAEGVLLMSSLFSGSMIVSKSFIMMMMTLALTGKSWTRLSNQLEMCLKAKSIWPGGLELTHSLGSIKGLISLLFFNKERVSGPWSNWPTMSNNNKRHI